jgi:predicted deacylase
MKTTRNEVAVCRRRFSAAVLQGLSWTTYEVRCGSGPRLCVMAGVHVNEVSSIAAAMRLVERFRALPLAGAVSIMPVVNLPALPLRSQHVCPVDQRNINFSFPGSPTGTFSEALADALLSEWAHDADCLVDLHGGDLCETVARFAVAATIGDAEFDDFNLALAKAFDPEIIVRVPTGAAEAGRSCSGRARLRQHAAFAECGSNGLLDEASVEFHVAGVLRIAHLLGITPSSPRRSEQRPVVASAYHWLAADVAGWCRYDVEPGERVERGQTVAEIADFGGAVLSRLAAPADGVVLWRCTHPVVSIGSDLFGFGA